MTIREGQLENEFDSERSDPSENDGSSVLTWPPIPGLFPGRKVTTNGGEEEFVSQGARRGLFSEAPQNSATDENSNERRDTHSEE